MNIDQCIARAPRLLFDIATSECELYSRILLHIQQYTVSGDVMNYKAAVQLERAVKLRRNGKCTH